MSMLCHAINGQMYRQRQLKSTEYGAVQPAKLVGALRHREQKHADYKSVFTIRQRRTEGPLSYWCKLIQHQMLNLRYI